MGTKKMFGCFGSVSVLVSRFFLGFSVLIVSQSGWADVDIDMDELLKQAKITVERYQKAGKILKGADTERSSHCRSVWKDYGEPGTRNAVRGAVNLLPKLSEGEAAPLSTHVELHCFLGSARQLETIKKLVLENGSLEDQLELYTLAAYAYGWRKNPAVGLAEDVLVTFLERSFSLNSGFEVEEMKATKAECFGLLVRYSPHRAQRVKAKASDELLLAAIKQYESLGL